MGKKGSWFSVVRKALSNHSEKKDKKPDKSKKRWFQKEEESVDVISFLEESPLDDPAQPPSTEDDVKQTETENEPTELAHSEAVKPAAAAAQPAVEEVEQPPSIIPCRPEISEDTAAIMIQSAFRGYTARKALRGLKALMRLRTLVQGHSVKRQVASTLKSMQTVAHVQSEIRARRIRMSEENQALHRLLRSRREKDFEKLKTSTDGNWNHSTQSKAQVEAKLLNKQEAAIRRERALAYSYSHQQTWKNSSKTTNVMDPNNPHWGWSWLERWMAARPWEPQSTTDFTDYPDNISVTSVATRASVLDILEVYARRDQIQNYPPTMSSPRTPTSQKSSQILRHQSLSSPKTLTSSSGRKQTNPANSRSRWGGDDDTRSTASVKLKLSRRHSIAGSSVRDDESLACLPSMSSYMTPSKSMKSSRSRLPSSSVAEKKGTLEKGSASTPLAKPRRLSFFAASPPHPRRQSSPPMLNSS